MDAFFLLIDNEVVFNEGVVMDIPIVKKLIRRDRGGVLAGDHDGRKKLKAHTELLYAWWVVNVNSPAIKAGKTGKELRAKAKYEVGLPDGWEVDEVLQEFIDTYSTYHDGSVVTTIKQLLSGFDVMLKSNNILLSSIKDKMNDVDLDADKIAEIIKSQKVILDVAGNIPKLVEQLKIAQIEYNSISESLGKALGDKPITSSMLP